MAGKHSKEGRGPGQRQLRVGELIRRQLSETLMRGDIHDPDLNRLNLTVSEVTVSPDLQIATVYLVPLGGKGQEDMFDLLHRNRGEMRRAISRGLTLKHTPQLRFRLDETFDRMDETRRLLSQDAVRRDLES
ncbi:30S ribosome-binding factor RbfA [Thalassococcus lentus]|uniref:Ribosome-binding factor A n=1 Tax=Thalassococcus lentus TaxID=1210524 RepID=A0ABT4XX32_9RHOB|nr:30S ribosome-binding factor RbfA [Thalassococcus lentus]MDA7426447.1 30S ribosome-binding factor RbfA [Thalassococcus lentus]